MIKKINTKKTGLLNAMFYFKDTFWVNKSFLRLKAFRYIIPGCYNY